MTQHITTSEPINGLDTGALGGLIDLLQAHPEGGRVTFAAHSRWQDGARSFTSFGGYTVDGQPQHQETRRFVLLGDKPAELSGTDTTPGPEEQLLHALATCIAATATANAALGGVRLSRLEVALESDLDLHSMFGLDPSVRPGIGALRATITLAGDADAEALRQIARHGYSASPVRDSVERGVPIAPEIIVADGPAEQTGR